MAAVRTTSRSRENRKVIMLVLVVVLVLAVLAIVQGYRLNRKNQEYMKIEQELLDKIEEETARQKELQEFKKYVETDDFIEQYARERLGLVYENDIILKKQ